MDDLEGARRMGREGQMGIGLSVQEQGEYDKGRRERQLRQEAWATPGTSSGDSSTGGAFFGVLLALALIAPAFAAPAIAVWATWTWLASTQGWDWPVLTAICVAEAVAILFLLKLFYDKTPALVVAVVASLYLGVAYAFCAPLLASTGFVLSAVIAMVAGAVGFLAGLTAPNKLLSAPPIACAIAIVLGGFLNVAAGTVLPYELYPLFAPIKWAGAGLALGGILRLMFLSKWFVLGAGALIALMVFLAPAQLSEGFNVVIGVGMSFVGTF